MALVAAVIALVAGGCSRENDEEQVRETLQRFADATARKDYQSICDDVFATKLVEEVKEEYPCELALKNSSLGDAQKPKLEIGTVKVEGDGATAEVKSSAANQPASQDTVRLVREGEDWRIIALSSS